jgi:hypothetical protein
MRWTVALAAPQVSGSIEVDLATILVGVLRR